MIIEEANIIETMYHVMIHDMFKYNIDFEKDKPKEIIAWMQDFNSKEIIIKRIESLMKQSRNSNVFI